MSCLWSDRGFRAGEINLAMKMKWKNNIFLLLPITLMISCGPIPVTQTTFSETESETESEIESEAESEVQRAISLYKEFLVGDVLVLYEYDYIFLGIDDLLSGGLNMDYAFYDMNEDGMPELLTRHGGNDDVYIFSCIDGELSLWWTDEYWSGGSEVLNNGDILHSSYDAYFSYLILDEEGEVVKEISFGKSDHDNAETRKGFYFDEEEDLPEEEWNERTKPLLSVGSEQIEWQGYMEWINAEDTVTTEQWKQLEPVRVIHGKSLYLNFADDIPGYRENATSVHEVQDGTYDDKIVVYSAGVLTDFTLFKVGISKRGPLMSDPIDYYMEEKLLELKSLKPDTVIEFCGKLPSENTSRIDVNYGIAFTDSKNVQHTYLLLNRTFSDENFIYLNEVELSIAPKPDDYALTGGDRLVVGEHDETEARYQLLGRDRDYYKVGCFPVEGLLTAEKAKGGPPYFQLHLNDFIFYDPADQFMSRLVKDQEGNELILLEIRRDQEPEADVRLLYIFLDENGFRLEHIAEYTSFSSYSYGGMAVDGKESDFKELRQYEVIKDTEFTTIK